MTVTCSRKCSRLHRQQMHAEGKYAGFFERAHEMAKISPLTGRFDSHIHSKTWKIRSPYSMTYECRNPKNWLKEHEEILDSTVSQALDGITKIKYTIQGKGRIKPPVERLATA